MWLKYKNWNCEHYIKARLNKYLHIKKNISPCANHFLQTFLLETVVLVKLLVSALQDLITTFIVLLPTTTISTARPACLNPSITQNRETPELW